MPDMQNQNSYAQEALQNMLGNFAQEDAYCSHARAHHFGGNAQRTTMTQQISNAFHYIVAQLMPSPRYMQPEEYVTLHRQMQADATVALVSGLSAEHTLPQVVQTLRRDYPQTFVALKAAIDAEAQAQAQRALNEAQNLVKCPLCTDLDPGHAHGELLPV